MGLGCTEKGFCKPYRHSDFNEVSCIRIYRDGAAADSTVAQPRNEPINVLFRRSDEGVNFFHGKIFPVAWGLRIGYLPEESVQFCIFERRHFICNMDEAECNVPSRFCCERANRSVIRRF